MMRVLIFIQLLILAVIAVDHHPPAPISETIERLGPIELPKEKLGMWNDNWRGQIQKTYQTIRERLERKIMNGRPYQNEGAVVEEQREKLKVLLGRYLTLAPKGENAPDEASGEKYVIPEELVDQLMGDEDVMQMWEDAVSNHGLRKFVGSAAARANSIVASFGNALRRGQAAAAGPVGGITAFGPSGSIPAFLPAGGAILW
ncbi:MAG: hypothetical protein M1816_004764 [Peltula sp. TS41687]|nr:MAG: hypothetical protein M1816_004764 [Peltula sp. TS41687]